MAMQQAPHPGRQVIASCYEKGRAGGSRRGLELHGCGGRPLSCPRSGVYVYAGETVRTREQHDAAGRVEEDVRYGTG
jgi:hypothetical protein